MAKKSASAAQAYLRSKSGAAKKKQSGGNKKSSGNKGLAQAYARHKSQEHGERVKGAASSNGDTNRKQRGDSSPRFTSHPKGRASGTRNMERTSRVGNVGRRQSDGGHTAVRSDGMRKRVSASPISESEFRRNTGGNRMTKRMTSSPVSRSNAGGTASSNRPRPNSAITKSELLQRSGVAAETRASRAASNRASTTRNRAEARPMTQSERRARMEAIMQRRPRAREVQHSGSNYSVPRKAENTKTRAMTPSQIKKMEKRLKMEERKK